MKTKDLRQGTRPNQKVSHQQRGLECELRVQAHFQARGFKTLFHRFKEGPMEIDLVVQTPDGEGRILVEVKSLGSLDFLEERVSLKQWKRLKDAHSYLSNHWSCPLTLCLAFVNRQNEILILEEP